MNYFKNFLIKNLGLIALLSVTLGLAPFNPEPHIWGKIKWIQGGAKGMQLIDWWDTFFHGAPFILLTLALIFKGLFLGKK
ncbi:hypothetical protein OAC27_00445 [Flavobacteriaceae bacterium]|nr:hypothetical protein [Flavobacteriaceae bacterium]MDC0106947.1 hypothetical protein [Flavobacteriaceae bacterium]